MPVPRRRFAVAVDKPDMLNRKFKIERRLVGKIGKAVDAEREAGIELKAKIELSAMCSAITPEGYCTGTQPGAPKGTNLSVDASGRLYSA